VPAAHVLCAQEQGLHWDAWWDYSDVADGRQPITPASLGRLEEAFQSSVSKCLRLPASQHVVLLSSGDDSRRILAALVSRGGAFRALTARTLFHGKWDLDAPWAGAMARELGFPHTVVEIPGPRDYARLDGQRRFLVDTETNQHTWALALAPHLPAANALIFDGLGGDVLGETGFEREELSTADEPRKLDLIAEAVFSEDFERVLHPSAWPSLPQARSELAHWLARLPEGSNRADLAFLLLRTRRSTALFGQQLLPLGNVTVCPYLELEYLREALRYSGVDKLRRSVQAACLEKFWPAYYQYSGTRRAPERLRPGDAMQRQMRLAAIHALQDEVGGLRRSGAFALLSSRGRALAWSARHSRRVAQRCAWWLYPLLSLVVRHRPPEWGWRVSTHSAPEVPAGRA
jgi:hypothetical protein